MEFEEKTSSRKEIYQGPIFKLVQDQVELPEGKGTAQRDLIFHNGAVCVLAVTAEDKIVLVKQYRKAIEAVSYEIPAGKLELGENADPMAAALRELEEEVAYTGKLELLYDFYSAIGFCNEKLKLYLASDLVKVENPRPQDDEETKILPTSSQHFGYSRSRDHGFSQDTLTIEVEPTIHKSRRIENTKRNVFNSKLNRILFAVILLLILLILAMKLL